jgi:hypothetical protein
MAFWKTTRDEAEDDMVIDLDERLAPYEIDLDAVAREAEPEAPAPRRRLRRRLVAQR